MPIQVACTCGKKFNAPSKYAGKKVKCPECKEPVVIPNGKAPVPAAPKAVSDKVAVKCKCGKSFRAKPDLLGKTVKCPGCSKPIKIGGSSTPKASKPSKAKADPKAQRAKAVPRKPMDDLFAEVGLADDGSGGRKCPECKSPMGAEAIICIDCGYNENLGRKMQVTRPVTEADRKAKAAGLEPKTAAEAKGAKKRKKWFGIF